MGPFKPAEVNAAFAKTCEELTSKYAQYPMQYERWYGSSELIDGMKVFIMAKKDLGFKEHYVWCKYGPTEAGYYHILTKTAHVNLYSRFDSMAASCCGGKIDDFDAFDTTRRITYNRARSNIPNDSKAAEQAIQHMAGTKLNPVHGLKL
jgi:hypothetical protein